MADWIRNWNLLVIFFHATLEHFKKALSFFASKSLLKSTGLQYIYSGFKIICLHVVCMLYVLELDRIRVSKVFHPNQESK